MDPSNNYLFMGSKQNGYTYLDIAYPDIYSYQNIQACKSKENFTSTMIDLNKPVVVKPTNNQKCKKHEC